MVSKAAPDGYTLLWVNTGIATNASPYNKLNHDPIRDFTAVTQLTSQSYVFVVHPSVPVRDSAAFDERERAVLAYTDAMTRDVEVEDRTFAAVSAFCTARQVVELTATVATYNLVSRFLVALQIGAVSKELPAIPDSPSRRV